MLLGKDDLIMDICPAYETDALVRRINIDRYDDREIIRTNLIESYDQLMEFGRKHLPDKFFLEGIERKNLRNIITREMIANILIHREFTSSYTAKFIIEKEKMYTENANRSAGDGIITPDNMEPNPQNPIIASFFRNIFKYSKFYSGMEPEFIEGDIFKIIVPLDENFSYNGEKNGDKKVSKKTKQHYKKIFEFMKANKEYTIQDFCQLLDLKPSRTKEILKDLSDDIEQIGNNKNRRYKLKSR